MIAALTSRRTACEQAVAHGLSKYTWKKRVKILFWLTLIFIVLPLVELALLLKLADLTDWKVSLLLVIVTGVAGAVLAKQSKHFAPASNAKKQTCKRGAAFPRIRLLDAAS